MAFTQKDLEELKQHTLIGYFPSISGKKMKELIERLKAAELLANCLSNHEDLDPVEITEIENWKKSKGA